VFTILDFPIILDGYFTSERNSSVIHRVCMFFMCLFTQLNFISSLMGYALNFITLIILFYADRQMGGRVKDKRRRAINLDCA
jgi:hypothetical protein